jgi:deazaflavin-dependent oxidoreductase (nitroreductase family)
MTMHRPGRAERFANQVVKLMLRVGIGPARTVILTVPGRKSGEPHSTPITLVERDGQRWLVAPYGDVNWARNARVAGQVTLRRGGKSETVDVVELDTESAGPILKQYLTENPITQRGFDVRPDSPVEDFIAEAPRHPVFVVK